MPLNPIQTSSPTQISSSPKTERKHSDSPILEALNRAGDDINDFFQKQIPEIFSPKGRADFAKELEKTAEDVKAFFERKHEKTQDENKLHKKYAAAILEGQDLSRVKELSYPMAKQYSTVSTIVNTQGKQSVENIDQVNAIINYLGNDITKNSLGDLEGVLEKFQNAQIIVQQYFRLVSKKFSELEDNVQETFDKFLEAAPHSLIRQAMIKVVENVSIVEPMLYKKVYDSLDDENKQLLDAAIVRGNKNFEKLRETAGIIIQNVGEITVNAGKVAANATAAVVNFKSGNAVQGALDMQKTVEAFLAAGGDIKEILDACQNAAKKIHDTNVEPVVLKVEYTEKPAITSNAAIAPASPLLDTPSPLRRSSQDLHVGKLLQTTAIEEKDTKNTSLSPKAAAK